MNWISKDPGEVVHPIELLPGSYKKDTNHSTSIYLPEEQFAHFESLLTMHDPLSSLSRYAFTEIPSVVWEAVIEDLNTWVTQIDSGAQVNDLTPAPSFLSGRSREQFLENEDQNLQALRETSENLATWLDEQVQQHEIISILGM